MENFVRPETACSILKVVPGTLRLWANTGKINFITTKGGHRRYNVNEFLSRTGESGCSHDKTKFCYARVSTYSQKKDLDSQQELFKIKFPDHTIIKDIGSGINFKRKGLLFLLEQSLKGNIKELIITHKDRLCRFGFEIISKVIEFNGGKIVVLYDEEILPPEQELVRDLISITTVFSSRLYGLRSHTLKKQIRNSHKKTSSGEKVQDNQSTYFSDGE
jgi:predicted site-specific integrase-resolvase